MMKRTPAALAVAALLAVGGFGAGLPAATAAAAPASATAASEYPGPAGNTGTDPTETGCDVGAYVVYAWDMHNDVYNEDQGLAQLVYSPACGTNWVNVYGFTPGNNYSVTLTSHTLGAAAYHAGVGAGDSAATLQSYSPGDTCVTVDWQISDMTTGIVEGEYSGVLC